MKANGFIKNEDLIREDCHVDDLLDFTEQIKSFTNRLSELSKPSIIALVGRFGSGKSTMLHQLKKESKDLWIEFDAWKYPDRKDLWEGFILDFATQIGKLTKIKNKIEGKSQGKHFIKAWLAQVPGVSLDKLFEIFDSSPVKRVFELQGLLQDLIQKQNKDIYIIVEDIDRSGDAGVYFLETLQQFIRDLKLESNKFIVIIPIGDKNYKDPDKLESYLKCIDYFEFFNLENVKLETFVKEVFDDAELHKNNIVITEKQIIGFLEQLFKQFPNMTPRLLKLILRKANMVYKNQIVDNHGPDFRVTICFEASKYFIADPKNKLSFFYNFKSNKRVGAKTIFAAFLGVMVDNQKDISQKRTNQDMEEIEEIITPTKDFFIIDRKTKELQPSIPYIDGTHNYGFWVASFYLNY